MDVSWQTRLKLWFYNIPIGTRLIMSVCVCVYLLTFGMTDLSAWFCLSPRLLVKDPVRQFYRLVLSPFVHLGLLHILFNMSTFLGLGPGLERHVGSMGFLLYSLVGGLFSSLVHVGLVETVRLVNYSDVIPKSLIYGCAAGYSGVLFAMLVVSVHLPGSQGTRRFCGVKMPAKLYPFVLLAFIQLIWPGVSLMGHLAGILTGYAYAFGLLHRLLPSNERLARWEQCCVPASVRMSDKWIAGHAVGTLPTTASAGAALRTAATTTRHGPITVHRLGSGGPPPTTATPSGAQPAESKQFHPIPVVKAPGSSPSSYQPFSGSGNRLGSQ